MTWKIKKLTAPDGKVTAVIDEPSNDTCTFVQHELPSLVRLGQQAAAIVRQTPGIRREELRERTPELAARCSDQHLDELIVARGDVGVRKWAAAVMADISGRKLATILRYSTMKSSRQLKQSKPGRPSRRK